MVETAKYDMIKKDGVFEIRKYHKMILAKVEKTQDTGFNTLFQYISGANKSKTKIKMTSPVITSEKITMTSPVFSSSKTMSFVIPYEYTLETLPDPSNPKISIVEIPKHYMATIRFRGFAWKKEVEKKTKALLDWLSSENIQIKGEVVLMQYNPPYVPGFLRKNEMGVEINY
jgi:effector-binding domain-containing protein